MSSNCPIHPFRALVQSINMLLVMFPLVRFLWLAEDVFLVLLELVQVILGNITVLLDCPLQALCPFPRVSMAWQSAALEKLPHGILALCDYSCGILTLSTFMFPWLPLCFPVQLPVVEPTSDDELQLMCEVESLQTQLSSAGRPVDEKFAHMFIQSLASKPSQCIEAPGAFANIGWHYW
jgi:hypothetical protein